MPKTPTWIPIARTGTFTDSSGTAQTFTESDLAAIAASYTSEKRDAPRWAILWITLSTMAAILWANQSSTPSYAV